MPEDSIVKSLITPLDQTLRTVFNVHKSYFIDIYQREYKWTEENVRALLDDIELRFQQHDRRKTRPVEIQADVRERFEPYFLNTYLTHTTAASTSIVDGQQRLTTLLLIFIKLYLIFRTVEREPENEGKTFSSKVFGQLIFETNDFGGTERFKIFNENREEAFRALIDGGVIEPRDETRKRIGENFRVISDHLERFLGSGEPGTYDLVKLTYYVSYLLDRISIVEIRIERQENVAMIFEVVNDRGLGLKPYEILKGKLIGNLPPAQKEKANRVWTELQERYFAAELRASTEKTLDLDQFFRTFFRAKFAGTETEYESFGGAYHYEMYRNPKIRQFFKDFHDRDLLFRRITEDIHYFADLYFRLRTSYDNEYLIFNKLLDQNQQYLLLLSNIERHDPQEKEKITAIARKFDQIHVILRLLDCYDSNEFQRLIYPLNAAIREKNLASAIPAFDATLIGALQSAGAIAAEPHESAVEYHEAKDLFQYERYRDVTNKWLNFSKYVLMRIDRYLSKTLDQPSFAASNLKDLEARFNKMGTRIHAMHLEHIYTQHPKNRALFTANGVFDESTFQKTRNLLGMVLLLKDKHNLSSNNEIYTDKQETYRLSGLLWNHLLVGHLKSTDYRELPPELRLESIEPADGVFPRDKVEARQRAIFAAIKLIWGSF